MWSAFSRLGSYLAAQGHAGTGCLTLTFGELEAILGRPLPAVARTGRRWWTNNSGSSQADYGWLAAGWQVDTVDRGRQTVTFRKA